MTATAAALPLAAADRVRRRRVRSVLGAVALSTQALVFLLVFFAVPLLRLFWLSVDAGTFAPYQKALTEGLYLAVFWETFKIAASVTALTLLLGYPVAYFLATTTRFWQLVGFALVMLPFWTSILVRTYAWMVLLGRNGVFNRALLDWGLITEPLPLLHNFAGVLVGMVHVLLPYMIFPIYNAMRKVDTDLVRAAEGLGAPAFAIFRRIYLPLTMEGILAGTTLVFILSLGFFITPALLGGGRVIMIAVLIEQQVREFLNWGFAGALSVVLLVATLVVYGLVHRMLRPRVAEVPR
jgi:ABC-type spermidine/putrescine transport system permease subunit I